MIEGDILILMEETLILKILNADTSSSQQKGFSFVGMGISGGEEGARFGPSMMPGTTKIVWSQIAPLFEPIAAKAFNGSPCITQQQEPEVQGIS